jgi:hypothetical protein
MALRNGLPLPAGLPFLNSALMLFETLASKAALASSKFS